MKFKEILKKNRQHFYRNSVKALVLDEQKRFLLIKEKDWWELPGGGLQFGENPQCGLKREIREEMNLNTTFIANNPSYFFTFRNIETKLWSSNILYFTKLRDLDFTPSEECLELRFFSKEEALKKNLAKNVQKFIEMYDKNNH